MSNNGSAFHYSVNHSVPEGNAGAWFATEKKERWCAEQASAELRDAMTTAIFKWGFGHGITPDQARVLLMDRTLKGLMP